MQGAACVRRMVLVAAAAASLAACATVDNTPAPRVTASGQKVGKPYQVGGVWYVPREQPDYDKVGVASWYGEAFHLKTTANGEIFDMNAVTAAHTTLPLPSIVEVTNLANGRKLKVRVNDRGPFVDNRIIDLSREAARQLGLERQGLARVRVRYVGPAPLLGREAGVRVARATPSRRSAPVRVARAEPAPKPRWSKPAPVASASVSYRDQAAFTSAPGQASVRQLEVMPSMSAAQAADASAASAAAGAYRIQAGAFSEEGRAMRAAAQLSSVGRATVEPVQRDGSTLYRVVVQGPRDELQAYNLRQKVAEAGFGEARVVGPF